MPTSSDAHNQNGHGPENPSNVAIEARNLGKHYRIGEVSARYRTLGETMSKMVTAPARWLRRLWGGGEGGGQASNVREIHALEDIDFRVERGEVIGIIGANGAGKSTLLKVLARITEPSTGEVHIWGRVGVLLEVGTGFHSELTGRENIYLNGAILGMRKREIEAKLDAIVDFAGVEKFIDTPVKFYSTGMELRLGFSVAAHLEPDILLVDEVLAVGDAEFQRKCLAKMDAVARTGRTVILVSHNMAAVKKLCQKTLWIEHGRLQMFDDTDVVVGAYLSQASGDSTIDVGERTDRRGHGPARLVGLDLADEHGHSTSFFLTGAKMLLELRYESELPEPLVETLFTVRVYDQFRNLVFSLGNHLTGQPFTGLPPKGSVKVEVPHLLLVPGRYSVTVLIHVSNRTSDHVENVFDFDISDSNFLGGTIPMRPHVYGSSVVPHSWQRVE